MADLLDRLELSRLSHRFGFGPKPGEFAQLLNLGIDTARKKILTAPISDAAAESVTPPVLTDLGFFPTQKTQAAADFNLARQLQINALYTWWLDRMALADQALIERMTWFWHGHWATSYDKVQYALPMKIQNDTLRQYALSDFWQMSRAMVQDPALLYWLDAGQNSKKSPNENLARELMELFTLGVGNYTETDVREIARGLTGWQVYRSGATTQFNSLAHDSTPITFLGHTGSYDAQGISDVLVGEDACQQFIPTRMWFRFLSTTNPMPGDLPTAFANRDINALVKALGRHGQMRVVGNSQVKSPVEWFIAVCRALSITPSKLQNVGYAISTLTNMGQLPFNPPNVGGWPADEAWLSASSAQFRLSFAQYLVKQGDLSYLAKDTTDQGIANWLGISEFSFRTKSAFAAAGNDPARLAVLAICSPEYVVNA